MERVNQTKREKDVKMKLKQTNKKNKKRYRVTSN